MGEYQKGFEVGLAAGRAVALGEGAGTNPIAWVITWAMRQSGPYASAYVTEDEARRAAKNIERYSDASDVKVTPAFASCSVTSNTRGGE